MTIGVGKKSTISMRITHVINKQLLIRLHGYCGFFAYTYCHIMVLKLFGLYP